MAISSTGLGSGLDVENIVKSLMAVERRPPAVLLRGAGGGVRVVAVAPGMSSWRPFVAIERDTGRQLVMKAKAARISCKIAAAVR